MRKLLAAGAALALLGGMAEAPEVADLGWLAGAWVSEKDGTWTEERWAPPRGGWMLGTVMSGRGRKAMGYEFMRIAPDAKGAPTFWASPEGKAPVPFSYSGGGPGEARFVNAENDYPNLIVYRRKGRVLTGTISKLDGSEPNSWTYRLKR